MLSNPELIRLAQVTSCTFQHYGSGGDKVKVQAICVLPLNILNEKIYYLIWFWYVALAVITVAGAIYRFFIVVCRPMRR